MAEQLSDLLHRSVDDLDVPPPDAARILGRGRSIRSRRRVGTTIAAAAAVATVVVVSAVATGSGGPRGAGITGPDRVVLPPVSAADQSAYDAWGSWAAGDRLTIGDRTITIDGGIAALTATSAGVVVRHQAVEEAGDPGDRAFVLVRPDGSLRQLSIPSGVVTLVGDLETPHVAWVEEVEGGQRIHVWDVGTDTSLADVRNPLTSVEDVDELTADVGALGDPWVHLATNADVGVSVDWRSGAATTVDYLPVADGDRYVLGTRGHLSFLYDPATGDVAHRFDVGVTPSLSPDGEYLFLRDGFSLEDTGDGEIRRSLDVPGARLRDIDVWSVWTPDGNLVGRGPDGTVRRCRPDGACEDRQVDGWAAGVELLLPGRTP
ncbi:hypothetical protein ACFQ0K_07740 [Nocardioides caeni]|uniref:WD40 repeat domain-containing protein n=1 Tax=Nocardioides caeni TaxID=574700 RepID=A0A4S8MZR0_9ACTN|nr:hypothetical protein [Nocardioides caeni]THV08980.1 hypothetical protein E9934_18000 [Nocardioides caeni]